MQTQYCEWIKIDGIRRNHKINVLFIAFCAHCLFAEKEYFRGKIWHDDSIHLSDDCATYLSFCSGLHIHFADYLALYRQNDSVMQSISRVQMKRICKWNLNAEIIYRKFWLISVCYSFSIFQSIGYGIVIYSCGQRSLRWCERRRVGVHHYGGCPWNVILSQSSSVRVTFHISVTQSRNEVPCWHCRVLMSVAHMTHTRSERAVCVTSRTHSASLLS